MKIIAWLRCLFWFIRIDPWRMWVYFARCGPRVQVFRNRRWPKGTKNIHGEDVGGCRKYIHYRWGIQILGFSFGDRGGTRNYVRREWSKHL